MASSGSGRKDLAAFLGSEFLHENICHPCYSEGKQLEAVGFCGNCQEPLCAECFKYHTKPTITKHHVLIEKRQSLRNTLRNTWKKKSSLTLTKNKIQKCTEHTEKTIKYFCPDHDFLGCSVCITLKHRLCEDMVYIPDVSKEVTESEEYKELENRLELIAKDSDELMNETKEKIMLVDTYNATATKAVDDFRQQINEVLDELKSNMDSKLKNIKEEQMEELTEVSKKITETVSEIKMISHQFELLNNEKQYCNTYIAMKKAKARLKALEQETQKAERELKRAKDIKNYIFIPPTEILEHIHSCKDFGKINFKDTKVTQEADIEVKTESDTVECWISGSAVLPNDKMVIADRNNKKVKVIDILQKEVKSEIQLSARPWDITKVGDTQVVVSLPNRKKLVFVNTEPDLKLDHEVSVKQPCYGLVHTNNTLIVANAVNHNVEILDMKGVVLKSFSKTDEGIQMFHTPCYVALSPDQLLMYVSSSGNNAVTCLTLDGSIIATYTDEDVKHLRQVVTDEIGMVYICGAQSNIYQITASCRKVKALLTDHDNEFQPFSISYDNVTTKLYIGMENEDVMKVFQIRQACSA